MDLSNLDTVAAASEGAVMPLLHPVSRAPLKTDDKKPITLTLLGYDSIQFQDFERIKINRRLNGEDAPERSAEAHEADKLETLSLCVKSWQNIIVDGKALECTAENVRMVLKRFPWIREQVDLFVGNRANFLPKA
jgi:hypothetical protein